jgi:hypothetical protein
MKIRVVERRDSNISYFFIGSIAAISNQEEEVEQVREWLADNLRPHKYTLRVNLLWFEDDRDACAFKLVWM